MMRPGLARRGPWREWAVLPDLDEGGTGELRRVPHEPKLPIGR